MSLMAGGIAAGIWADLAVLTGGDESCANTAAGVVPAMIVVVSKAQIRACCGAVVILAFPWFAVR